MKRTTVTRAGAVRGVDVDDQTIGRRAVRAWLETWPAIEVVGKTALRAGAEVCIAKTAEADSAGRSPRGSKER